MRESLVIAKGRGGGSDRRRSGDLSIFSRTLYQLSYRAFLRQKPGKPGSVSDPDGT